MEKSFDNESFPLPIFWVRHSVMVQSASDIGPQKFTYLIGECPHC
jgi:hypothetical protein